jgi:serine/threonine-protein kinase
MRFIRGDSLREAIERFHGGGRASEGRQPPDPTRKNAVDSLELRRILRRFLDVCNAIDYAHSRGVLHRDIKPGNIIIGKYGETLVVDWGLAKATGRSDPAAAERTLVPSSSSGSGAETLPGSVIGTPAYMSPEQAAGELDRLSFRSDVYSLGATLYCLLTGKPPIADSDVGAMLRAVQSGDFPDPRRFNPSIDKALEAICLKAMATRPEGRYETPKALADDIERWLAEEPVTAWEEPLGRNVRRQLVKHRSLLGALMLGVPVALFSLSSIALHERLSRGRVEETNTKLVKAQKQTADALKHAGRREGLTLKALSNFRHAVESNPDLFTRPELGNLRRRLLSQPLEYYRELREEAQTNASDADPQASRTLAYANWSFASIAAEVGVSKNAIQAYKESLAALEPLLRDNAIESEDVWLAPMLLNGLGLAQVDAGQLSDADNSYQRALALTEQAAVTEPKQQRGKLNVLARTHQNLALLRFRQGQSEAALEQYRETLRLRQDLLRDSLDDREYREVEIAVVENLYGRLIRQLGHFAEARRELDRACSLLESALQSDPTNSFARDTLARVYFELGTLARDLLVVHYDADDGLEYFQKCLELSESLTEDFPQYTFYRKVLVDALDSMGEIHNKMRRYKIAEPLHRRAVEEAEALFRLEPASLNHRNYLCHALNHLGLTLVAANRPGEAVPFYDRAITLREQAAQKDPDNLELRSSLAGTYNNRGLAWTEIGSQEKALSDFRGAIEIERECMRKAPHVVQYRLWLRHHCRGMAKPLRALKRWDEAYTASREGYELQSNEAGPTYDFACDLALLSDAMNQYRNSLSDEERLKRDAWGERALVVLRQAIDSGFSFADHMATDPDLRSLRSRPEFQKMLLDLSFPSDPFVKTR